MDSTLISLSNVQIGIIAFEYKHNYVSVSGILPITVKNYSKTDEQLSRSEDGHFQFENWCSYRKKINDYNQP